MKIERVAIIGSGTIGRGWIPLFARAGLEVMVYDVSPASVESAITSAGRTLADLADYGLVKDAAAALRLVRPAGTLKAALSRAHFIQESVPENVSIKRAVLSQIDERAPDDAIISSSCSSLDPAEIFRDAAHPERCIVTHPFNPPHLLPLVELLPSVRTSERIVTETVGLMKRLGQVPVIIRKPVLGYVANRLQAAVVNEAMSLVGQGVISPADLDLCITEALGRRWAFLGPFETMDFNAEDGIEGYASRYRSAYEEIGTDLKVGVPWPIGALEQVIAARRAAVPVAQLDARRRWRDRTLMDMLARPPRDRAQGEDDESAPKGRSAEGKTHAF